MPGGGLFRGDWQLNDESILKEVDRAGLTLLSGIGTQTGWELQLRADDQQSISHFQRYCHEYDIPITVTRLYALSELRTGEQYQLTSAQEEALTTAFKAGYFDQPREVTLEDITDELDISRQSLAAHTREVLLNTHHDLCSDRDGVPEPLHCRLYCPQEVNRQNQTNSRNRPHCRRMFYFGYQTNHASLNALKSQKTDYFSRLFGATEFDH
ncbi:helix-turn-helix domain-containing protein [Haladaptatus pallidirubidus]|uniref:helix-turn-helix domain-containing protein n=1 Tax=Haladaptatus pallidirubidus TaxID=1008152 RepID=UPI001D127DFD|nr:helix-turn-helix domain-containing protein [Haladaptatus pallidirubidus]